MCSVALKGEAEDVRDKADRIVRLILARQAATFYVNGSEDADYQMPVTPAMKQAWNDKITQLQADIKTIVGGW